MGTGIPVLLRVAVSIFAWRSAVRIRGLGSLGALKQTLRRTSADNDTKHGAEREIEPA
jgi:hypothetical protein